MHLRASGPTTILMGIAAGPVLTNTQRMRSVLVYLKQRARGMVRHAVRRGIEHFEPVMFWEADDQEICMLALGCSNDPRHLASVDQNCFRFNSGRCRSLYSALLKSPELAALFFE